MATAISKTTLEAASSGVSPGVYGLVTYTSSRSGNYMVYNITVAMGCLTSGAWYNNRWAVNMTVNGSTVWSNKTIKAQTSGEIGTTEYSQSVQVKVAKNSGTVPIKVHFADTGYSTSWTYTTNWGEKSGSLAVTEPSAPSTPSSISIPTSIAPDQTMAVSWSASSGGTNGVSGYEVAYKTGTKTTLGVTIDVYSDSINVGNVTSKSLDLNSLGFEHGDVVKCRVRSYTTVNSTKYYSGWKTSSEIQALFVAPSAPSTISIPSSIAPDKTATISWSAASGGTNGVKGYEWQWSNDGGNTWPASTNTTNTSGTVNLGSNGFKHGSKLAARVRAYTTGQGTNYYSAWKTSGTTTTNFVAPTAPRSVALATDMAEPIPTGTYKGTWLAPSSTGSNGISGYRIQWLKNGSNLGSEADVSGTSASKALTESDIQPGDILSFKVRAYTIGQSTRYYSDYTASTSIEIVSDKFIYLSQNGGTFVKYKAFISINGGSFTEIKKEKLKVIK